MAEKLLSANIKRISDAQERRADIFYRICEIVVTCRQDRPHHGKFWPTYQVILDHLGYNEVPAPAGGAMNLTAVKRVIKEFRADYDSIPTAQEMEDALPEPRIHRFGNFRLLEDVSVGAGDFNEGDYGTVDSFDGTFVTARMKLNHSEEYEIEALNRIYPRGPFRKNTIAKDVEYIEGVILKPTQIRMVPRDLMTYYTGHDAEHEELMIRRLTGEYNE